MPGGRSWGARPRRAATCWPGAAGIWPSPADPAALETALGAAEPDGHGLTALPFLAGERSPGWRPEARAAVTGLSLDTGAVEITRALLESVAFRLAEVYDRLSPLAAVDHVLVASGGALAHSPTWAQIVTDALGVPVAQGGDAEASARGAALLALEALGVAVQEAPAPLRPSSRSPSAMPGTGRQGSASAGSMTTLSWGRPYGRFNAGRVAHMLPLFMLALGAAIVLVQPRT